MVIKYKAATTAGTLILLIMGREHLLKNNLFDNGNGIRKSETIVCTERSKHSRTEDGTCNVQSSPLSGASQIPLGRNVKKEAIYKEKSTLLMPNPLLVSEDLLKREEAKPLPLNLLVTAWIQFQNHDWFDHTNNEKDPFSFYRVPVPAHLKKDMTQSSYIEQAKGALGLDNYMFVPKTKEAGQLKDANGESYSIFSNRVTHWWDGSQIYGSDAKTSARLRSFSKGKMLVDGQTQRIPYSDQTVKKEGFIEAKENVEQTGFFENWWTGLSLLHNLFIKNHNLLASDAVLVGQIEATLKNSKQKLYKFDRTQNKVVEVSRQDVFSADGKVIDQRLYSEVVDQIVYDKVRLINTAIIAKIHTVEWTPAVLQTRSLDVGMRANWYGALQGQAEKSELGSDVWAKAKSIAEKLKITDITKNISAAGLVGGKTDNFGVPFTITEEFTSVYRLHSLLPEELELYTDLENKNTVTIADMREEKSKEILEDYKFGNLFYSFGHANSMALTIGNFPNFLRDLEVDVVGKLDIAAIDVLRDRERGVPRYNEFRRQLSLNEISSFADLFMYQSNLSTGYVECLNMPIDNEQFSILSNVISAKNSLLNYEANKFNSIHCKLVKMNKRLKDYKELYAQVKTATGLNKTIKTRSLEKLKLQIQEDNKEKYLALKPDQKVYVDRMKRLYNTPELKKAFQKDYQVSLGLVDNVDSLDLLVGSLAETFRPEGDDTTRGFIGFGFGETPFQIFVLMASRRLMADRFYSEDFKPAVYTQRGIDIVNQASMKTILTCNLKKEFPQIEKSLKCIRTAFHPWNDVTSDVKCSSDKLLSVYENREQEMISYFKKEICPSN